MKIELKKISFNERMSEETNAFTADLYINGKKVGYCKNQGHGGPTDYHADTSCASGFTRANIELIAKAEAYFKSLPKVKDEKYNFEYQPTLENAIDEQLENYLKAKETKKMQKLFATALVFGVPNGNQYRYIKYKQPLSALVQTHKPFLIKKIMELKVNECKNGVVILNTNLEALGLNV